MDLFSLIISLFRLVYLKPLVDLVKYPIWFCPPTKILFDLFILTALILVDRGTVSWFQYFPSNSKTPPLFAT